MTAKPDGRKDGRATPSPRIPPSPEPTASDRSAEMIASDGLQQWSSSPNAPTLAQSPHDPQRADRAPGDSPKPRIYRPFTVSSARPEGPSRRTATATAQMLARLAACKHGALEAAVLLGVNDAAHAEEHRQRSSGPARLLSLKRPRQIRSELADPPCELAPGGRSRGTARAWDLPRVRSRPAAPIAALEAQSRTTPIAQIRAREIGAKRAQCGFCFVAAPAATARLPLRQPFDQKQKSTFLGDGRADALR